jgi:hypothetical protein
VIRDTDERDVREGLREVAYKTATPGVVFFREQAHIVRQR